MSVSEFLQARIVEDEERAEKNLPALSSHGLGDYGLRVLAECVAKRVLLLDYAYLSDPPLAPGVAAFAAIYKDHPDYQKEWAL
jgi:hypothetical protein